MNGCVRVIACLVIFTLGSGAFAAEVAYSDFVELRAGPGSGYPVFVVIEQGEHVNLVSRLASWYKVRSGDDTEGWVKVEDLYAAIFPAAELPRRLSMFYDDRRYEASVGAGLFGGDSYYQATLGYRLWSNLTARAGVAKSIGDYSSSTIYTAQLVTRLFPAAVVSPVILADIGYMTNIPRKTLVSANSSTLSVVGFGFGVDWNFVRGLKWHNSVVSNNVNSVANGSKVFVEWQTGLTAIF